MNILFILPQIQKGGGQTIQALGLAECLMNKGHKIFFLTFRSKVTSKEIGNYLKKFKIYCLKTQINYFTFLIAPFLINKFENLVKKWKIDVIQSFDPHLSNLFAVYLGNKLKLPVYCRIGARYRDFYEDRLLKGNLLMKFMYYSKIALVFLKLLEYYTIKRVNSVISNSHYILTALKKSFLLKNYRFNWRKIPNGINLEKFSPNKEIPLPILNKFSAKRIILYVGRIEDYKGIDTLFRALSLTKKNISDIHLILIGAHHFNKPYYNKLQELITDLQIGQNISFLGEIPHSMIPIYLSLVKNLILPSYSPYKPILEGCPNVILEAMSCQCLVIASNIGGIPEIIQDEINGLLFEPNNHHQLADLLISIWSDSQKADRIAENGRETIMEKFTFEKIAEKYLKIYNQSSISGV